MKLFIAYFYAILQLLAKKIVFHCLPPPSGASFVGVGEIGILWPNIFKDKYQHQSYISIDSEKRFDIIT